MRYAEAVASAPAGSRRFQAADLVRLSPASLRLLFETGPASPPLADAACALGDRPRLVGRLAAALPAPRAARLLQLARRPVPPRVRAEARERLVRGSFWFLVYELEPLLWDRLAAAEPVSPALLAELPSAGARVVDVGAGTGRLAAALAERAARVVAVEPVAPLRRLLRQRHPALLVIGGVGHRLPIRSGWADLVVSCATFGPDPPLGGEPVRAELERCARPGGLVALVGPEDPGWWEARGYRRSTFASPAPEPAADLDAFFGPRHPPRTLLTRPR